MYEKTIKQIETLAKSFGFLRVYPEPNKYMISFRDEEKQIYRINVYFTKMTVTVQSTKNTGCETYRDVNIEDFENILERLTNNV